MGGCPSAGEGPPGGSEGSAGKKGTPFPRCRPARYPCHAPSRQRTSSLPLFYVTAVSVLHSPGPAIPLPRGACPHHMQVEDLETDIADHISSAANKQKEFEQLMKVVKAAQDKQQAFAELEVEHGELQVEHKAAKTRIQVRKQL